MITRRGFLAVLTGSTAALAAGVTIPVVSTTPAMAGVPFAPLAVGPEFAAFELSSLGDWMALSGITGIQNAHGILPKGHETF